MVWAPATKSARRSPRTPSPDCTSPSPLSHAERTAHSTPRRSRAVISSPVRMPSSRAPSDGVLAPARASPVRLSGLSLQRFPPVAHGVSAKNPWVARCRIRLPGASDFTSDSVALAPVSTTAALPCSRDSAATKSASRPVSGSGRKGPIAGAQPPRAVRCRFAGSPTRARPPRAGRARGARRLQHVALGREVVQDRTPLREIAGRSCRQ